MIVQKQVATELYRRWKEGKGKIFGLTSPVGGEKSDLVAEELVKDLSTLSVECEAAIFAVKEHHTLEELEEKMEHFHQSCNLTVVVAEGLIDDPRILLLLVRCDAVILHVKGRLSERGEVIKCVEIAKRHDLDLMGTVLSYSTSTAPSGIKDIVR